MPTRRGGENPGMSTRRGGRQLGGISLQYVRYPCVYRSLPLHSLDFVWCRLGFVWCTLELSHHSLCKSHQPLIR